MRKNQVLFRSAFSSFGSSIVVGITVDGSQLKIILDWIRLDKIRLQLIGLAVIPTTMEDPNEEKADLKRT